WTLTLNLLPVSRRTVAPWLAYVLPYRRFDTALAVCVARLGVDAVCYSFIVADFHPLLLAGFAGAPEIPLSPRRRLYSVHVTTRNSLGDMTRKLSVTESRSSAQLRGTFSRRNSSVASANWVHVA